jgi:hypothetical protein
MSVLYKTKPKDGSLQAWDYITKVYGEIETLQFNPNCCGLHNWFAKLKSGKTASVDSKELMGERGKL